MAKFNEMFIEIFSWFQSGMDFTEGVALLSKYNKNKRLVNYIAIGESSEKRRDKLIWELRKIANLPEDICKNTEAVVERIKKDMKIGPGDLQVKTEAPDPGSKNDPKIENEDSWKSEDRKTWEKKVEKYPQIIQDFIKEKGDLHKKKEILFNELKKIPQNNQAKNIQAREEILKEYDPVNKRIEELYLLIKDFENDGKIPEVAKVEKITTDPGPGAGKTDQGETDPLEKYSTAKLIKMRNNFRSNISKDRKKIEASPGGPKRTKIVNRLTQREKDLKKIEDIIKKREDQGGV